MFWWDLFSISEVILFYLVGVPSLYSESDVQAPIRQEMIFSKTSYRMQHYIYIMPKITKILNEILEVQWKWSHLDLKRWFTGEIKIRPAILSNWRTFESNWLDIESQIINLTQYSPITQNPGSNFSSASDSNFRSK